MLSSASVEALQRLRTGSVAAQGRPELRWFERQVESINTVCHGLSVLASFYRWLVQTGLADTTPITAVRRPSRDDTQRQTRLTRHELADWLNTAEQHGGAIYAMACLLLLNGLRASEVCGIDIDDLAEERWHHTSSPRQGRQGRHHPPRATHAGRGRTGRRRT
jgi:integrase